MCLYKQFVSYDRAKMEKIGDFFALTWLIFTGPITFCISKNFIFTVLVPIVLLGDIMKHDIFAISHPYTCVHMCTC